MSTIEAEHRRDSGQTSLTHTLTLPLSVCLSVSQCCSYERRREKKSPGEIETFLRQRSGAVCIRCQRGIPDVKRMQVSLQKMREERGGVGGAPGIQFHLKIWEMG